jgi:hypothetical protein
MYTLRATDDLLAKERYLVVKDPFASAALLASGRSLEHLEDTPEVSHQPHTCAGGSHSTITRDPAGSHIVTQRASLRTGVLPVVPLVRSALTPRQGGQGATSAKATSGERVEHELRTQPTPLP